MLRERERLDVDLVEADLDRLDADLLPDALVDDARLLPCELEPDLDFALPERERLLLLRPDLDGMLFLPCTVVSCDVERLSTGCQRSDDRVAQVLLPVHV